MSGMTFLNMHNVIYVIVICMLAANTGIGRDMDTLVIAIIPVMTTVLSPPLSPDLPSVLVGGTAGEHRATLMYRKCAIGHLVYCQDEQDQDVKMKPSQAFHAV